MENIIKWSDKQTTTLTCTARLPQTRQLHASGQLPSPALPEYPRLDSYMPADNYPHLHCQNTPD